jgi:hypothetical protein
VESARREHQDEAAAGKTLLLIVRPLILLPWMTDPAQTWVLPENVDSWWVCASLDRDCSRSVGMCWWRVGKVMSHAAKSGRCPGEREPPLFSSPSSAGRRDSFLLSKAEVPRAYDMARRHPTWLGPILSFNNYPGVVYVKEPLLQCLISLPHIML